MQTLLITGANGFVGYYLTQRMLTEGYNVVATGKGPERLQINHPRYSYCSMDVSEAASVNEVFARHQPSLVVHGAAMTKPDECELQQEAAWQVNVGGTGHVVDAANACGAFLVHLSTDFIFEGTANRYTEADEGNPVNYYGKTKLEAEGLVKTYAGSWAILRPILMYGQPQVGRQNILTFVADALRKKEAVRLFTDQRRFPTYVEDFVWGIAQVVRHRATGIFHFCGKDALSPFEMGVKVAEFLMLDKNLVQPVTAAEFFQPAKRPPQTMFDLAKVEQLFGYQPTSFEEGLRKTFGNNEQKNKE